MYLNGDEPLLVKRSLRGVENEKSEAYFGIGVALMRGGVLVLVRRSRCDLMHVSRIR